jgi:hypothetical protein
MTMATKQLLSLGIPESGCGDIRITGGPVEVLLEYEYSDDGFDYVAGVKFSGVVAFRFRDEPHSRGFQSGSYNALVEILDSAWVRELRDLEPKGMEEGVGEKRHFAVYLDSNGYFETVAADFAEVFPKMRRL